MLDRRIRLFFAVGSGSALALLLNLAATAIVARLLGPSGFGQWTLIIAAGALVNNVLLAWTHAPTIRFGAEEWEIHRALTRTVAGRLPLLVASLALAVPLLVAQPFDWLQRAFGLAHTQWWLAALWAVSLWLAAEAQATLRASDRLAVQAWLAPVARGTALVALLPLVWAGTRSLGAVALALALPPIVLWGGTWVAALRGTGVRVDRVSAADARQQLRYAWPVLPALAVGYVSEWGDHILLRALATPSEVGLFALAYQVFTAILVANGLFTTVLLPRLVAAQARASDTMLTYVRDVAPTLLTLWMIVSLWAVATAPPVLASMGGGSFRAAVGVISVLCIAVPASVILHLFGTALDVQQRLGTLLTFSVVVAAANVALSLLLIPRYGAVGAAAATAAAYVVGQGLYIRDQHQWGGVPAAPMVSVWIAGAVAGIGQTAVESFPARIAWAVVATGVVTLAARRARAVDPALVSRLFTGRLRPFAAMVNLTFVAPRIPREAEC